MAMRIQVYDFEDALNAMRKYFEEALNEKEEEIEGLKNEISATKLRIEELERELEGKNDLLD